MTYHDLISTSDANAIKRSVDIVAVAEQLGLPISHDGSEFKTLCLWHPDTNPSLGFFTGSDGAQRAKCHACDFHGDVFDLVQKKQGVTLSEAITLVVSMREGGLLEPPPLDRAPTPDLDAYASRTRGASDPDGVILSLLHDRGISAPLAFVRDEFRVGVNESGDVIIPHYDAHQNVRAVKRRVLGTWEKKNVRGSRMDALYGEWRDRGFEQVILAEGESDTWTLAWKWGADFDVLGLPSGVAETPKDAWLERLRDRDVTIAFDADDAGRLGLQKWLEALVGVARSVMIAIIAEGADATEFEVTEATSFSTAPIELRETRDGYGRPGAKGEVKMVSDWTVKLERVVKLDREQFVFEVSFPPFSGNPHYLSTDDLNANAKLRKWANARGYAWKGTDADCQELLRLLQRKALTVPRVAGTHVVGLHENAFVLPDSIIGSRSWAYVAPMADVQLHERISIQPGAFDRQIPSLLTRLHAPDVVTPILGWCAAAAVRATLPNFPILAVVGGSGWGKTTLVGEIMKTFGYSTSPMTITSTTPHAVSSLIASTNAIPVWFDEYRHGARADSKEKLDQKIRDAWDGASSMKGGMKENLQALTAEPACAPIVITGEDAFSETSHAERMVIVSIPKDGRDPQALGSLRRTHADGFGHAYLSWIVDSLKAGTIPAPPVELERMVLSRAIAAWGYDLFRLFAREVCGIELVVDYDESRVVAEHAEMNAKPPILEAVSLLVDVTGEDGRPVVWRNGEDVYVRPEALVKAVGRHTDLVLPGKSKATAKWLRERFRTSDERHAWGRAVRLIGARREILAEDA